MVDGLYHRSKQIQVSSDISGPLQEKDGSQSLPPNAQNVLVDSLGFWRVRAREYGCIMLDFRFRSISIF